MKKNYDSGSFWNFVNSIESPKKKSEEKKDEKKIVVEEEEGEEEEDEKVPNSRKFMLEFMKRKRIEGKLLFTMVSGSVAYNLNLPTSDFDYIGVYVAPTKNVLSLGKLKTTHHQTDPDVILYEISDFCNNLIKGNPLLISMVFTSRYMVETPEWRDLKKVRDYFVTEKSIKSYFGYHEAEMRQVKKCGGTGYNKVLFHAFRLLFEIESILNGNGPIVFFPTESESRKFMMNIRNESESEEKKKEHLLQLTKKKEELKALEKDVASGKRGRILEKSMSEKDNKKGFEALNSWLIKQRKDNF